MFPQKRSLQSLDLHPSRGVAPSGFRPLWKIPHCCLPQKYGPCLSSIVTDHPLRPVIRHSLGELLPHQLADRTQAPPQAINFYSEETIRYQSTFQWVIPDLGADSNVLLTRSPLLLFQQAKITLARLACVRRTASVHPELGSNSFKRILYNIKLYIQNFLLQFFLVNYKNLVFSSNILFILKNDYYFFLKQMEFMYFLIKVKTFFNFLLYN